MKSWGRISDAPREVLGGCAVDDDAYGGVNSVDTDGRGAADHWLREL